MAKRITLLDVAKDAGVSRATASLVLRDSDLVARETRARVLASMQKLGYVYNRTAASLRAKRSNTIGLVVTDITNPFFAELAVSIETQLDEAGYALLLSNTRDLPEKQERLLRAMNSRQIDGLLFCPAEGTTGDTIAMLDAWGVPCVLVARQVQEAQFDYAGADNYAGARMAVAYLVEKGHTRIAFVGGKHGSSARMERERGMKEALEEQHLAFDDALSVSSPVSRQGGYAAIRSVLDQEHPPTAALCYNDVVAFGVMLGLQSRGLTPGQDFAIVGFDDIEDAALVRPALTTVAIKPREIGNMAISLLLERIQNPTKENHHRVLSPRLIVRDSA